MDEIDFISNPLGMTVIAPWQRYAHIIYWNERIKGASNQLKSQQKLNRNDN